MGDDIDWGASNERLRHQHEEYARRLRNGQCVQCGSTFLGGEEPHRLTVTDELGTRVELRCGDCIEAYSQACWNNEEWVRTRRKYNTADGREDRTADAAPPKTSFLRLLA